jgi:predicted transposase
MEQVITAKLKLNTTPEQNVALRKTQLAYRDALNYVSQWAFEHGKLSNQQRLQQACYDEIRDRFGLPAQMACNVPRQVGATYKALWEKVRANASARNVGYTQKRYKGLDKAPKYVSPTLTYNLRRDYSFRTDNQVSVRTLDGRVVVPYTGYNKHVDLIHQGADQLHQQGVLSLWAYKRPEPASSRLVVCLPKLRLYLA